MDDVHYAVIFFAIGFIARSLIDEYQDAQLRKILTKRRHDS
jgi:hypothetical protein